LNHIRIKKLANQRYLGQTHLLITKYEGKKKVESLKGLVIDPTWKYKIYLVNYSSRK